MLIPWRQRFASESGLTLIELLVVCVIIVILSLLAMPIYAGANDRARQARSADELRVISEAIEAYNAEFGHYPANLFRLKERGLLKTSMSMQTPWSTPGNVIYYFYAVDRSDEHAANPASAADIARAYALGDPGSDAACGDSDTAPTPVRLYKDESKPLPCGLNPEFGAYAVQVSPTAELPKVELMAMDDTPYEHPSLDDFRSDLRTRK